MKMAKTPTPTTIKANARRVAFQKLCEAFSNYDFLQTGDSEIAVPIDTAPTGEPIYALFSPTVKDYCERKTPNKVIPAYDPIKESEKYAAHVDKRIEKAEIAKKKKAEKIEQDRIAREKAKERLQREG